MVTVAHARVDEGGDGAIDWERDDGWLLAPAIVEMDQNLSVRFNTIRYLLLALSAKNRC